MDRQPDERFPRWRRIVRGSEFRAVYDTGRRIDAGSFVLFGRPNGLGYHRLGLTVSRKVGCAAVRNRVKRRFREIFRKSAAGIPQHYDLVVNAKRDCTNAAYATLRDGFISAARKICRDAVGRPVSEDS